MPTLMISIGDDDLDDLVTISKRQGVSIYSLAKDYLTAGIDKDRESR